MSNVESLKLFDGNALDSEHFIENGVQMNISYGILIFENLTLN